MRSRTVNGDWDYPVANRSVTGSSVSEYFTGFAPDRRYATKNADNYLKNSDFFKCYIWARTLLMHLRRSVTADSPLFEFLEK